MHALLRFYVKMRQRALLAVALVGGAVAQSGGCRYARKYTCDQLRGNSSALQSFLFDMMHAESAFHAPGIGYEPVTAFTYDGHALNYTTGELADVPPHTFSAPSKESLHLGMLALAVSGNPYASIFTGGMNASVELLSRKMKTYMDFNASYPGYGCFLPWVTVEASGIRATPDWSSPYRVPGLDNGEMAMSVLAAAQALTQAGYEALGSQYWQWFSCMARNAKTIFYNGDGTTAAVVVINNITAAVTPGNYNRAGGGLLNDPYEGETLTVLMDIFGDWSADPAERDLLWITKRPQLVAVNYTLPNGTDITVQQGFWFSAHEQWKTMLLPYLEIPSVRTIFANCERARTWDAAVNRVPGLFASVNDVTSGSIDIPDYVSATGIQVIASQVVLRRDIVTPYGAWVLFLHDPGTAACWYRNMLAGSRMQGPYGSTEGTAINGTEISPLTTWDSKITTAMAAAGGVYSLTKDALQGLQPTTPNGTFTAYDRFVYVIAREYGLRFPVVVGDGTQYAVPTSAIPTILPEWSTCT